MVNVLKARDDLGYQLALLSTELTEIFTNAPTTLQSSAEASTVTDIGGRERQLKATVLFVSWSSMPPMISSGVKEPAIITFIASVSGNGPRESLVRCVVCIAEYHGRAMRIALGGLLIAGLALSTTKAMSMSEASGDLAGRET